MLELPHDCLAPILGTWGGDGDVYEALAATSSSGVDDEEWTRADVRRRASRVLVGRLAPLLERLPATAASWDAYLPVVQATRREVALVPSGGTDWSATAREFGWPPRAFHTREREREVDVVALTALAWVAARLNDRAKDVQAVAPDLWAATTPAVGVLSEVATTRLGDTTPARPDRLDLRGLASSGYPWHVVAEIAGLLARAETDVRFLAFELIQPDPAAQDRLFHLAVLGEVLRSFSDLGFKLRWRAPIQKLSRSGPQVVATKQDETWDIWFEARGARSFYHLPRGPYRDAVRHVAFQDSPLGADVAIVRRDERALLLECKWSEEPTYVARGGFHQIASYALDARLAVAPEVWSFIVGPQEIVTATSVSDAAWAQMSILLGSMSVVGLPDTLGSFVSGGLLAATTS